MNDVYESCPVLESDHFLLRLLDESDAVDLTKVYSDKKALPFFNGDNCNGSNFYFETPDMMRRVIKAWLREYERRGFVRFTIVDKRIKQAIGTVELFNRQAEDFFNDCGFLRLDVGSCYEEQEALSELLALIVKPTYELFGCQMIATKAPLYAVERMAALRENGFEKTEECVIGHDQKRYYDYWIVKKA